MFFNNENESRLNVYMDNISTYYDNKVDNFKDKTVSWAVRSVINSYLQQFYDKCWENSFEIVTSITFTFAYYINLKYGISYRYFYPVSLLYIRQLIMYSIN